MPPASTLPTLGRVPLPRVARTRRGHIWGETWRLLVAFLFGLAIWGMVRSELHTMHVEPRFGEDWLFADLLLGAVATILLLWRRRWPLGIALTTTLMSSVSSVAIGASAVALVSLSTRRRWRDLVVISVPYFVSGWVHDWVFRPGLEPQPWSNVIIGTLVFAVLVAIGWAVGERRAFVASLHERAVTAEREQAMRVVQAKLAERARIAREMHDVLAHRISLVSMHSGVLVYRKDLTPDEVAATAEIVRDSANKALAELRAVLGVLRDVPGANGSEPGPAPAGSAGGSTAGSAGGSADGSAGGSAADAAGAPEPPQPTLRDLDELLAEATTAGATVVVERSGDLDDVPEQVSRNAYRIVQECLTNARKHAPGMTASLAVARRTEPDGTDAVHVTVRNGIPHPSQEPVPSVAPGGSSRTGPDAPAPSSVPARVTTPPGAGLGLLGLTERAVLAGGELRYGQDRRGDFVVTARLPWAA
jgi:signal transduction histidine kinase